MDLRTAIRRGDFVRLKLVLDSLEAQDEEAAEEAEEAEDASPASADRHTADQGRPAAGRRAHSASRHRRRSSAFGPSAGAALNEMVAGSTPLHLAIGTKQPHFVALLLRHGADPDLADDYGYSPIHLAVLAGEQAARRRNKQRLKREAAKQAAEAARRKAPGGASSHSLSPSRSRRGSQAGTSSQGTSQAGSRPVSRAGGLHATAANQAALAELGKQGVALPSVLDGTMEPLEGGDLDMLKLLLEAGANPDRQRRLTNGCGRGWPPARVASPLFEAVCGAQTELVRCLLANGADPNLRGRHKVDRPYPEPPLHVAARTKHPKQVEVCKLLLQYGAEPGAVAGGLGDDGGTHDLVDASHEADTAWLKSLITGLQMAERNRVKAEKEVAEAAAAAQAAADAHAREAKLQDEAAARAAEKSRRRARRGGR